MQLSKSIPDAQVVAPELDLEISSSHASCPAQKTWRVGTLTYTTAGLMILFCWLLWGDFAWMIKERAVTPVVQVMLRGFDAPLSVVSLLLSSFPAAIGMILGPIISVRSDRHRSRWGRRIPFLLIPTPIIVLSMFGLAATPAVSQWLHQSLGERSPGLLYCRVTTFACFWSIFEISTITVNCLVNALVNDVVPQAIVGRFLALFRAVSLLAGILFNFFLMGHAENHAGIILVMAGLIYGLGFTMMCLNVKEGQYPPVEHYIAQGPAAIGRLQAVRSYLVECLGNPFYLRYFLATTLASVTMIPVNAFSVFHASSVGLSDELYGKAIALSYAISLFLAYPLGILADRFHPIRLGIVTLVIYATAMALGFAFGITAPLFFIAFVMHTVFSASVNTATASIGQRLLPPEKFGEFASAGGVIISLSTMIVSPALGYLITNVLDKNYRFVFLLACLLSAAAAIAYVQLLSQYKRLGGDEAYIAP